MTTGLQGVPRKAGCGRQAAEYRHWCWGWRHHYDNRITGVPGKAGCGRQAAEYRRWCWGWRHHYNNRITGCTRKGWMWPPSCGISALVLGVEASLRQPDYRVFPERLHVAAKLRNIGVGAGGGSITMTTGLQGVPGKAGCGRQAAEYRCWCWGWRHHYDNRITGCTRKGWMWPPSCGISALVLGVEASLRQPDYRVYPERLHVAAKLRNIGVGAGGGSITMTTGLRGVPGKAG